MINVLLLITTLNTGTISYPGAASGCEKCNIEILVRTETSINTLSFEDVQAFFCTMDDSCRSNVEFSEFSTELVFRVLAEKPGLFMNALSTTSKKTCDAVLDKLETSNDFVDLKKLYESLSQIDGPEMVKSKVLKSIKKALAKGK